ncbi:hypothetical protein AALP_AA6G279100 [Arabis alpina]|uniref:DUF4283 domain-containing protein n=1 Tax=Arabis alpina TaxID=50452 RepID=A0A087GS63_ARAAL|nr:hypothetical protein AALP_AA6G279100 [Arabis alpina]
MSNHWFPQGASALNPRLPPPVDHRPPSPHPPKPPDPSPPLPTSQYPPLPSSPLSSIPPMSSTISSEISFSPNSDVPMTQAVVSTNPDVVMAQADIIPTIIPKVEVFPLLEPTVPDKPSPSLSQPSPTTKAPILQTPPSFPPTTHGAPLSLAERIKRSEDKTLHKLDDVEVLVSDAGRPRVKIPDSVFKQGADLHKEFVVGYFCGRTPAYGSIQSVLNHIWGKGLKLEIHVNSLARSMLVRIPNDFIRHKVLEKKIWYAGDTMFHVAQWGDMESSDPKASDGSTHPKLSKIPLWAHLKGIPFDLIHDAGLSRVAELIGYPKEMDDFTKNLTRVNEAHVKVEIDVTKPLPSVIEIERENGRVDIVEVEYPWVPPSYSNCKEIGHLIRNCHKLTPKWVPKTTATDPKRNQSPPVDTASPVGDQTVENTCPAKNKSTDQPDILDTNMDLSLHQSEMTDTPTTAAVIPLEVTPEVDYCPTTPLHKVATLFDDLSTIVPRTSSTPPQLDPLSSESPPESLIPYVVGLPVPYGLVSSRPPVKNYTTKSGASKTKSLKDFLTSTTKPPANLLSSSLNSTTKPPPSPSHTKPPLPVPPKSLTPKTVETTSLLSEPKGSSLFKGATSPNL